MALRIAMILGRTVWTQDADGWRHEIFKESGGVTCKAVERLTEFLSEAPAQHTVVIFEPTGIAHQMVETPKVNREAFASLARIRNDHPVVESEILGWGIEYPEPGPGGTFSTLIHSELTPGLVQLRDACAHAGCRLFAAWPAYTAAVAFVGSGISTSKAKYILILTAEYSAIVAFGGGKRSFKGWVGPMSERDWKALSALIGDFEARPSPTMGDTGTKRGSVLVIAEGEQDGVCPFWKDLCASGRLEAVLDLEAFAISATRIPPRHPANLVEAFPRPRELDRTLVTAAIVGLSVAILFGCVALADQKRRNAEDAANRAHIAILEGRLRGLNDNKNEMERIRIEPPDAPGSLPVGLYGALVGLAEAIPDALTMTSLTIGKDGGFELEAIVVGPDFNQENTRLNLAQHGFIPATIKGWVYDASSGRVLAHGRYEEPRP